MFCSVGGLTRGLQMADLKVSAGLDIDASCQYAYEKNCNATFIKMDIQNCTWSDISKFFEDSICRVLVGCAPCQLFSSLAPSQSRRIKEDKRWNLINDFCRIILEGMPEIVSMENVPRLIQLPVYRRFKQKLIKAGYQISDGLLLCAEFGVPQNRRRLVMLGSRLGKIEMPVGNKSDWPTVRQVIGELPPISNGQTSDEDTLHVCSKLDPVNLARIRASKPGGSWARDWPEALLPECYRKESGKTFGSVYGRMKWDAPSPTITTQFNRYGTGRFGHPDQDRALSLREGALLQTFPQGYEFFPPKEKITMSKVCSHIGNAVPPLLGRAIGRAIKRHIEEQAFS